MDGRKDASCTDYNALLWSPAVRVWGPKVRHCRNYNQKHHFCLRFVVSSFYTGSFQVPPEKNHPQLKCQFPPKIPI